jgi:ribosomal protein S7
MRVLCTAAREAAFKNNKSTAECLAGVLINATKVRSFIPFILIH